MADLQQPGGSGAGSTVETSEPMPRGLVHDLGCRCWPHIEASAVTQLRADLEDAQGEIEVEREAGRIQRNKAISNYAEVRRLRNELERATGLQEATLKQLVGSRHDLAQARARTQELVRAITTYRQAAAEAGQPMLPWPAFDIALDAAQAAAETPREHSKPSTYTVEQVRQILEHNGQLLERISQIGQKLDRWGGIDAALAKVELLDAVIEAAKEHAAHCGAFQQHGPDFRIGPLNRALKALDAANAAPQPAQHASAESDATQDAQPE